MFLGYTVYTIILAPVLTFFFFCFLQWHINVTHLTNHPTQVQMCGTPSLHFVWTPGECTLAFLKEIPDHQTFWIRQLLPHKLLGLTASDPEKHFLISSRVNISLKETWHFFHSTYLNSGEFNASHSFLEEAWVYVRRGSVKDFLCRKMNHFTVTKWEEALAYSFFHMRIFFMHSCVHTKTYIKWIDWYNDTLD